MTSGSFAGAEMITLRAPASRCLAASSRDRNRPVEPRGENRLAGGKLDDVARLQPPGDDGCQRLQRPLDSGRHRRLTQEACFEVIVRAAAEQYADRAIRLAHGRIQQPPARRAGKESCETDPDGASPSAGAIVHEDRAIGRHMATRQRHVGGNHIGEVKTIDKREVEGSVMLANVRPNHGHGEIGIGA